MIGLADGNWTTMHADCVSKGGSLAVAETREEFAALEAAAGIAGGSVTGNGGQLGAGGCPRIGAKMGGGQSQANW